jgi:tetratricopeptide (TPR) repeat protein
LVQEFKGEDLELDSADDLAPLWGDAATVNLPVLSSVDKVEAVQDAADRLWMPENNVVEGAATASSLVDDLFSSNLFSEGESEVDDEAFKVETLKSLFENQKTEGSKEITTETLADLYLSQGQYDKALRMLDRIYQQKPNVELLKKLNKCRERLGVGRKQLIQQRQIEFLKNLLQVAQRQKRALSKLDS